MTNTTNSGESHRTAKTALITGASAGLGADFANLFAADGHNVILVARRRERLEELAETLRATHGHAVTVMPCDLTVDGAVAKLAEDVHELGIDVNFLVNNAGFGTTGAFAENDLAAELRMIDLNIRALVELTGHLLPKMVARKSGRVLTVGSTAGFQGGPFMATYYASKAFVNHWSEALSLELEGSGVTVTVSCPGPTATEFGGVSGNDKNKLFAGALAESIDVAKHAYAAMMKGKRMAIFGIRNKMLVQTLRITPRSAVLGIARKLNRSS